MPTQLSVYIGKNTSEWNRCRHRWPTSYQCQTHTLAASSRVAVIRAVRFADPSAPRFGVDAPTITLPPPSSSGSLGMRMIGARKRSGVDRGIFVGNRTTGVDENAPSRPARLLMLGDQIIKVRWSLVGNGVVHLGR